MDPETITQTIAFRLAAAEGSKCGLLAQEGLSGNNLSGYIMKFWVNNKALRSAAKRKEIIVTISIRGIYEDGTAQLMCRWNGDWSGISALELLKAEAK